MGIRIKVITTARGAFEATLGGGLSVQSVVVLSKGGAIISKDGIKTARALSADGMERAGALSVDGAIKSEGFADGAQLSTDGMARAE